MALIPWRRKRERRNNGEGGAEMTLARLRHEMDALFDRFFRDPWDVFGDDDMPAVFAGFPRTDVAESEDDVTVRMELPGVDPKDVEIQVAGGLLTVRGEKKQEKEEKKRNYHFVERRFGSFQRTVQLPSTVDPDRIEATFKNGVLTITIGKHAEVKPRRITVKTA